jgi:hypothetical protein
MTLLAGGVHAACVILAPPNSPPLAHIPIDDRDPTIRVTYLHSVTRTQVDEAYRVEGTHIVQTEIRFVEHGPGLPTAPDPGGTFEHDDGKFLVRGQRSFDTIVMRVHADQQPVLVAGTQSLDLARWGNRALAMTAHAGRCAAS